VHHTKSFEFHLAILLYHFPAFFRRGFSELNSDSDLGVMCARKIYEIFGHI